MTAYINKNMTNNEIYSDSSMDKQYLYSEQKGGEKTDDTINFPTGGFPPIFISHQHIEKPLLNNKQRQFIKPQNTFSIRNILVKDHTP